MAQEPEKPRRNADKSKAPNQKVEPIEFLTRQHQELQSSLAKRSEPNADHPEIVRQFAALWLPHQAVEAELLVPFLRKSGFDPTKIAATEVRKDIVNILLANLLGGDGGVESAEAKLDMLA